LRRNVNALREGQMAVRRQAIDALLETVRKE
jgi:hypothetical protein